MYRRKIHRKLLIGIAVCLLGGGLIGCAEKKSNNQTGSDVTPTGAVTEIPATPTATTAPTATPTPTPIANPLFADTTLLPEVSDDGWSVVKDQQEAMEAQYKENSFEIEKLLLLASKERELPIVSFTTLDSERISSREQYVATMVNVTNCDAEYELHAFAGVKVRGNSTADSDPRPYRIKFKEAQGMLGLHDGEEFRSWVLLKANWNLVMDYTAFKMYPKIQGGSLYSSDCTFVNVYINGSNKGLYLLCEQNQAVEGRVEVTEPEEGNSTLEIGYFLELDNYAGEKPVVRVELENQEFTDWIGQTKPLRDRNFSIKSEIRTEGQRAFIENYMNGVAEILLAAANGRAMRFTEDYELVYADDVYTPQQAVEAVVDVDAAISMMILSELAHDYDVGEGSFYLAVDFHPEGKFKKLTMLAPWDYNWAYNPTANDKQYFACTFQEPYAEGFGDRSNFWYIALMKMDWYREKVKSKWQSLMSENVLLETCKEIDAAAEECRRDTGSEGWRVDCAHDVVNYVRGRIEWLDSQWGQ